MCVGMCVYLWVCMYGYIRVCSLLLAICTEVKLAYMHYSKPLFTLGSHCLVEWEEAGVAPSFSSDDFSLRKHYF